MIFAILDRTSLLHCDSSRIHNISTPVSLGVSLCPDYQNLATIHGLIWPIIHLIRPLSNTATTRPLADAPFVQVAVL
jgi:hypothetical protein